MARHGLADRPLYAAATHISGLVCTIILAFALFAPVASAETEGQAIVQEAKKWEGHPYCFDGGNENEPTLGKEDPENGLRCGYDGYDPSDTPGFDCRGLALYAVYQGTDHTIKLALLHVPWVV